MRDVLTMAFMIVVLSAAVFIMELNTPSSRSSARPTNAGNGAALISIGVNSLGK